MARPAVPYSVSDCLFVAKVRRRAVSASIWGIVLANWTWHSVVPPWCRGWQRRRRNCGWDRRRRCQRRFSGSRGWKGMGGLWWRSRWKGRRRGRLRWGGWFGRSRRRRRGFDAVDGLEITEGLDAASPTIGSICGRLECSIRIIEGARGSRDSDRGVERGAHVSVVEAELACDGGAQVGDVLVHVFRAAMSDSELDADDRGERGPRRKRRVERGRS